LREIRVFVSSPDDARFERQRLERVVERLNGELAGAAILKTVRWETSFYKAHATFQAQIPEAADCELVIAILRHRLGTELPEDFPKMPNGEPYPSGTAYEVLSAIEAGKTKGLPDVYVFRSSEPPTVRLDDAATRALVEDQWGRLKNFLQTWFLSPQGQFKAAFQSFASTDDFEAQAEKLLRQWIEEHILKGRAVVWPVELKGSPFRGLKAFGARHAPVFFGRSRDIERAIDAWKDAAEAGTPFLLVIGPSGAGKSSLARAGLIPRLTAPGVLPKIDLWRVVTMLPGERGTDPFAALAGELLRSVEAVEAEDAGRPAALPEIAGSDYRTPQELSALLTHADAAATKPIVAALDRVAATGRNSGGYDRPVNAALLLLVDQLDELFAADISDETRQKFSALLVELVRSGRVWLLATLRADLYERTLAVPQLVALKQAGASYDLAPPGPAELAEIVREPAKAADLVYETDASGRALDERLLADAERADMLPLLQFTLNRLYDNRVSAGGETRLTHSAYDAIGGLDGAIDNEAERALASLSEAEIARLPRLLRELATTARAVEGEARSAASLTIRSVPLARAAHDGPAARLVKALVDARILLSSGEGGAATIRIAHQRVLESWNRAREILAEDADFLRIREEVEDERRRWESGGKKRDRLIAPGLRLAEAESIQKRFKDEIPAASHAFISASGRRARLKYRLTAASAFVFLGVAIAAGYLGWLSQQHARAEQVAREEAQRMALAEFAASQEAQRSFGIAKQTVDGIIAQVAQGLRGSAGVPIDTVRRVLSNLESAVDRLAESSPQDFGLRRSRYLMLIEFGDTYRAAGESMAALDAYQEALAISRQLVSEVPTLFDSQREMAVALQRSGILRFRIGQPAEALAELDEALAIGRKLVAEHPDDVRLWQHISRCLNDIGDIKKRSGESAEALAAFSEAAEIGRRLVAAEPGRIEWKQELAASLLHMADVEAAAGDIDGALAAYEEALSLWREVAATDPGNMDWLQDVSVGLTSLADVQLGAGYEDEALAAYEEALAIRRRLTHSDPGNMGWQRDLGEALERVGTIELGEGNAAAARPPLSEALELRRHLVASDPENLEWQRDLAAALIRIGDVHVLSEDSLAAVAAYEESLAILRRLTEREPGNSRWQRNLAGILIKTGVQQYAAGALDEALRLFEEALTIRRGLIELDPANTHWKTELVNSLAGIANATNGPHRAAAVEEALAILEGLRREGALTGTQAALEDRLRAMAE